MTYQPDFYDIVSTGSIRGDLEWYERKAHEHGGPVLELGAGTGRVTVPLAQAGVRVYALDASAAMLERLRARLQAEPSEVRERVTLLEADMRDFRVPEPVPLVIAPARAFLHNLTEADRLACLRCVARHLQPGGVFAFNVFHPSLDYMAQSRGPFAGTWRWTGRYSVPGGSVICSEATHYDTVRQQVHSLQRFEEYDERGLLKRTALHDLRLAYLYPGDIYRMLGEAGFDRVTITGGFDGRPFTDDRDELVIEAARGEP